MIQPLRIVEERFRHLVVLAVLLLKFGWVIWLVTISDQATALFTASPHGAALVILEVLNLALVLLAGALSVLALAVYNPTGRLSHVLGALLPTSPEGVRNLERSSWVPVDLILVLSPITAIYGLVVRQFIDSGRMSLLDYHLSFAATITLVTAASLAATRMSMERAFVYITVVQVVRFVCYLALNGAVLPDATLVVSTAVIYSMVALVVVTFIRRSAGSLDSRITSTTNSHRAITRGVAAQVMESEMRSFVERYLLSSLRQTAHARTPQEAAAARTRAAQAVRALDARMRPGAGATLGDVPQDEMVGCLADVVREVSPRLHLVSTAVHDGAVPRITHDHLLQALREFLTAAVTDEDAVRHLRCTVETTPSSLRLIVHADAGYASRGQLESGIRAAKRIMTALPGGEITTLSTGAGTTVTLSWTEHNEHFLRSRAALTSDMHDEVSGQFKIRHALPSRRMRLMALIPVGIIVALFLVITALSWNLYHSQIVNLGSLLLAVVICGIGVRSAFTDQNGGQMPHRFALMVSALVLLLVSTSLPNLRDQAAIAVETQWWQGSAALAIMLWLTVGSGPWLAVGTAVATVGIIGVWGAITDHTPNPFLGTGMLLLLSVSAGAIAMGWATGQMEAAALERRRRRATYVHDAHQHAALRAQKQQLRYVDEIVRPFLLQQISGFPLTAATRQRAEHLAARLQDDLHAPAFRGTAVARAAADARARGVQVTFADEGAMDNASPFVQRRAVLLTVHALDAMVDGKIDIRVLAPHRSSMVEIRSLPADEDPRRTRILPDASVDYDGTLVRAPQEVI